MNEEPERTVGYFHARVEANGWSLRDSVSARRRMYKELVEYCIAQTERHPAPARVLPLPLTMTERVLLKLGLKRRAAERVMRRLAAVTPMKFEIRSWQRDAVFVGLKQPHR